MFLKAKSDRMESKMGVLFITNVFLKCPNIGQNDP